MATRPRHDRSAGIEPAIGGDSAERRDVKKLPVDAHVEASADQCVIRISVRREDVAVQKETFVAGVATVRRVRISDEERIGDTVRAEQLRVDVDGDVSVVRQQDVARVHEDREEAR